jgi:hypothetical protein
MAEDPPPVEPLFGAQDRETALRHGSDSHFRWLTTTDDPEAVALRAALQRCFKHAGARGEALRRALRHERWGQHVGALAQLLTLGLLAEQGWSVASEPALGHQSPDILAARDGGARLLLEVRAVTGAGNFPWEQRRAAGTGLSAQTRAALSQTLAAILQKKAETYRPLVERLAIAYVIVLYEDKDSEISALARELLFGRGAAGPDEARAAPGGLFCDPAGGLAHVSGVIVFSRLDTPGGELRLGGDLLLNPCAREPLPAAARFPRLRAYGAAPPAPGVRWLGPAPGPFAIDGA